MNETLIAGFNFVIEYAMPKDLQASEPMYKFTTFNLNYESSKSA